MKLSALDVARALEDLRELRNLLYRKKAKIGDREFDIGIIDPATGAARYKRATSSRAIIALARRVKTAEALLYMLLRECTAEVSTEP